MHNELLIILVAVSSLLGLASLVGVALREFASETIGTDTLENYAARVKSWWWTVLVLAGAFLSGRIGIIVLFAAISFIALREFLTLTSLQAADRRILIICFAILLPAQYVLVAVGKYEPYVGVVPFAGLIVLPLMTALTGNTRNYLARTAELLFGFGLCVCCISYIPALLMLQIPGSEGRQILLILFLILVTQASDVFQYIWGKALGRHRVAPAISPSKTVEGLIGGVASATALGAGLWWMTPFSVLQAGAAALLIASAGFGGGLVLSAIKRDRGVKDWGNSLPGHGGVLDRIDSLCFSAPVFFYFLRALFEN